MLCQPGKDQVPLSLLHKIPHVFPLSACVHLPLTPHALERIAQGSLWLEIGTDLLSAEAFRVLTEECRNPLTHLPTMAL
jgi:hypothetical protein